MCGAFRPECRTVGMRWQEFSNGMLEVLHCYGDDTLDGPYLQRVRRTRLRELREGRCFAVEFAEKYVGL